LLDRQPLSVYARRESGDPGCVRDYVFVSDVVRANVLAVQGKLSEPIVNVCTGVGITTLDLARALGKVLGVEPELRFGPRRAGDVERSVLDGAELVQRYPATSLDEGLRQTAAWFADRRTNA
jgi:UDP-glucose 4-epimerase